MCSSNGTSSLAQPINLSLQYEQKASSSGPAYANPAAAMSEAVGEEWGHDRKVSTRCSYVVSIDYEVVVTI